MGNVCNKGEEAEKFETAYAFDYVEESLATWACRSISRSQPIERKVVLKVSETERRMESYRPLLSESQDEPQPLPFFGGNFCKDVFRNLCARIFFVVPFWAMLTYGYYFLSLVLVLPFLAILNDITKYRYFLSAESQSEAFVMEYIRKLQRSPIAEEGSDGPVLLVEAWHNDGDGSARTTQRLDFREHMYLKHALKAEYTGSTEAEEDIRLALRKAAKEKKALAIESTFFVEIDPDLEKMVVSKLKHMMSKAADKTKLGGSRRALLLLRPHCEYTKVMLSINNARDAQEPGKKGGESPNKANFYLPSCAAYAQYYSVRLVFGPAVANRLFICSKTLHCRVNFKVKISPTGATLFSHDSNDLDEVGREPQEPEGAREV